MPCAAVVPPPARVGAPAGRRRRAARCAPTCAASAPPALTRRELGLGLAGAALALSLPAAPAGAAVAGDGRLVLVTGANSGIGYETALGLARQGFACVLACRTVDKGRAAAARITAQVAGADVRVLDTPLELGDLRSVAAYADAFRATAQPLHVLINNAVRGAALRCERYVQARVMAARGVRRAICMLAFAASVLDA
jgi:hypothetical protein